VLGFFRVLGFLSGREQICGDSHVRQNKASDFYLQQNFPFMVEKNKD